MPCYDGQPDPKDEELSMIRASFCGLLRALEAKGEKPLSLINYNEAGVSRVALQIWWNAHKVADEARRSREAEEARLKVVADQAYNKLTPEERTALGLPRYKSGEK